MRRATRKRSRLVVLAGVLLVTLSAAASGGPRYADLRTIEPIHGDAAAGAKKATVCFACHGANGASMAPMFPRLAGQRADYLYQRLQAFRRSRPKDPYYSASPMTPNAVRLSDRDMRDLAAFFAAQTPTGGSATPPPSGSTGESLFLNGDPMRGIPPCQGCHGPDATGPESRTDQYAAYPALRAQYAPYLTSRLTSFRKGLPHDSTNAFIMGGVASTLDDESVQAIAGWLSSLTPQKSP